ncbi:MAG: hypothetical protein LLG06_15330 [Desulfobacteraceae bacterium]|nr:hypothetical protein [Desulfobacteraceae bacterium]
MWKTSILFLTAFLWASTAAAQTVPAPDVTPPVKKVVLYKHGMGYIEREGKIRDSATLSLAFRAEQMKDLLTSFFAVDLNGGKISAVRYETRDPISKQLQDILITVPEKAALSQFLAQLKGARLNVKAAGETVSGRILGIEPITEVAGNQTIQKGYRLVLLSEAGPIRSLDLFSIAEFSLADEALQRDLNRLLDISLDSKYTNRKKLTLTAAGQGERTLRIGYLIEMPIWKCSYRVIFDDKKPDAPPLLQGWALIENTTEDDWSDVAVSFVAGNPISYIMDLYSPYYVRRAQVPIPGLEGLSVDWGAAAPPDLADEAQPGEPKAEEREFGLRAKKSARAPANVAQQMDRALALSAPAPVPESERPSKPMGELLASSFDTAARGVPVGELFSYEARDKVSVPRGQAAMVPIISKGIHGRRLLYYKAAFSPRVTNAYVVSNDTDLTFEAGAMTFFEGSTSLGEGILGHTLPPGSQEVVPYAIDPSVDINTQSRSKREPHFKGTLVDGILTLTSVETLTNSWKIVNRGKKPATLWLNQPKKEGFRLSKPEKPLKEVDNHYRFEVQLKAGETVDFAVEEKRDVSETVQLAKIGTDQVRFYIAQPYLSAGAKAFLKEVGELMAQKAALQREINEGTQKTQRLTDEQKRLRSNLESLRADSPKEQELRAKWIAALSSDEDQLLQTRTQMEEAGGKLRQMEEALARKIREYRDK